MPAVPLNSAFLTCVSSPFMLSLYRNPCARFQTNQCVVETSEKTVIRSLVTGNSDISSHKARVDRPTNSVGFLKEVQVPFV